MSHSQHELLGLCLVQMRWCAWLNLFFLHKLLFHIRLIISISPHLPPLCFCFVIYVIYINIWLNLNKNKDNALKHFAKWVKMKQTWFFFFYIYIICLRNEARIIICLRNEMLQNSMQLFNKKKKTSVIW